MSSAVVVIIGVLLILIGLGDLLPTLTLKRLTGDKPSKATPPPGGSPSPPDEPEGDTSFKEPPKPE